MDDDHVKIGPLVPAAGGPGAEEYDGLNVGLDRQVPAEIDCGRVGARVDYVRHLVADAVSSHRRHGMVSGRPARRRQWTWWWWSTMVVTGGSPAAGLRGDLGGQKMRDNLHYRAENGRAQAVGLNPLSGLRRAEKPFPPKVRPHRRCSGAAGRSRNRLPNVAVLPTTNRLVSIPMVSIPLQCNGRRHGMGWYPMHANASRALATVLQGKG